MWLNDVECVFLLSFLPRASSFLGKLDQKSIEKKKATKEPKGLQFQGR